MICTTYMYNFFEKTYQRTFFSMTYYMIILREEDFSYNFYT
jgi:hypothetical protein